MKEYDTSEHVVIKPVVKSDHCGGERVCKGRIMDSSEECVECYKQTIRNISTGKGIKNEN